MEALEPRLLLSLDGPGYLGTDTAFNDHGPSYALVGDPQPEPAPDATPPEASLRVSDVTRFGGSRQLFRVKYTDDVAVDVSDIDDDDVQVTGPEDFDEFATLVHVYGRGDGKSRTALYRIAAPDGTWDPADNGTYTIVMQANQVSDTSENFVAAGELGTFEVNVAAPPEASLTVAEVLEGETTLTLTVEYSGDVAIDVADLDDKDIWVTGPRFHQHATFVSVDDDTNGTPRTATYQIDAPGDAWDAADNGTYRVIMRGRQVSDTNGNFVRPGILGSFTVDIEPAPDDTPPEASLRVSDVTRFGGSRQFFRVKYTDDVAVDVSDIDDTDMRVIGPEGFDELATLVHVYGRGDGKSRRALYQIAAPGGTWDSADNGTYTIVMRTDQVSDTSDNFVAAGELGTFEVNVPEPPSEPGGNTTTAKGPHGPLSRAALDHLFKIGALG